MRITHLVENLERGGLERVVIDLVGAQCEAGHDCRVICLFEHGVLATELLAQGVAVQACGKRTGTDLAALRRLRSLLRGQDAGVVHTHNAVAHYHAVLATTGLSYRRIVNTRHGMGSPDPRSRRERLYQLSMRRTHAVATVCDAARHQFQRHGMGPRAGLQVVRNGIRVERFDAASPARREQLASELGFPPQTRLLGTVGRLNPVKDQATLIRAFARLRTSFPATGLVLIGDGDSRGELEACAAAQGVGAHVRFLGDRGDVQHLLPGLDVFVLSSLSEGYSIALLEACAAALPIVATDVGGNREIVRPDISGELVAAGDTDSLAAALVRILADPGRASRMGRAGRDWVLREGSLQTMAERYLRLYSAAPAAGA